MRLLPTVDDDLRGLVSVGAAHLAGLSVAAGDEALARETTAACVALRARFGNAASGDVPGVAAARALYRSLAIDPTKHRPSSEALLRRALRGESLYRVNTLVDVVNLSSLRQQLPYGLYDADRIRPPTILRRGLEGEEYDGIRKGRVNVAGRPTLADAAGPFGNPTSDSARTMVTLGTSAALVVLYAPGRWTSAQIEALVSETIDAIQRWCGGAVVARAVRPEVP